MPKYILVICDDTPSIYSADNGQMKDNPQQICEGRSKTTMCVFICVWVHMYVLSRVGQMRKFRTFAVLVSCFERPALLYVPWDMHTAAFSPFSLYSQPVLPQTLHLNSHRNRINKSPAQTASKGTWQCGKLVKYRSKLDSI